MAWRAFTLLNGGFAVLSAKYQSAVSAFTCVWSAYCVPISVRRSAGITSPANTTSALPFSTCVTSSVIGRPYFSTIWSGYPSGCASGFHTLKFGLRTSTASLFGSYDFHMYGPVPGGTSFFRFFGDVLPGTTYANGSPSLSRNSGSG